MSISVGANCNGRRDAVGLGLGLGLRLGLGLVLGPNLLSRGLSFSTMELKIIFLRIGLNQKEASESRLHAIILSNIM